MWKIVLGFGILCTALLILMQLAEFRMIQSDANLELVVSILAVVFFSLGLIFRNKFESKPPQKNNLISDLGLSRRELEVVKELVEGKSNKEIADELFLSESTIKSHLSNIYSKLEVKNRVQAISKAKEAGM